MEENGIIVSKNISSRHTVIIDLENEDIDREKNLKVHSNSLTENLRKSCLN